MTAASAKKRHQVPHVIGFGWEPAAARAETQNSINATRDGTRVIPRGCQAEAAIRNNAAAGAEFGKPENGVVHGGHVEWAEKSLAAALICALDDDTGRQPGQPAVNQGPGAIGAQDKAHPRVSGRLVFKKHLNNLIESRVQGRFPPKHSDALPWNCAAGALFQEVFYDVQGDIRAAGGLGAGAVAIVACEIATVSDVYFHKLKTSGELRTQ